MWRKLCLISTTLTHRPLQKTPLAITYSVLTTFTILTNPPFLPPTHNPTTQEAVPALAKVVRGWEGGKGFKKLVIVNCDKGGE